MYHQDVSVFQGTWYYDGDLSAETFIVIDGYGNWSFFRRTSGDADTTETDHGTLSYSENESSTYYAHSAINDCCGTGCMSLTMGLSSGMKPPITGWNDIRRDKNDEFVEKESCFSAGAGSLFMPGGLQQ